MKKKILAAMLAALAVGAMALTGCSFGGGDNSTTPSSAVETPPVVSGTVSSETASSETISSETVTSEDTNTATQDTPVTADPAAFETKFAANPIDAAYAVESQNALTNLDMLSLEEKYANLWIDEINAVYPQLFSANAAGIEEDKKNWNDNLDSELEKIGNSVEGQGSLVRVERAIKIKNFFRDKAKELYGKLYELNPDYNYHYTA